MAVAKSLTRHSRRIFLLLAISFHSGKAARYLRTWSGGKGGSPPSQGEQCFRNNSPTTALLMTRSLSLGGTHAIATSWTPAGVTWVGRPARAIVRLLAALLPGNRPGKAEADVAEATAGDDPVAVGA